MKKLLAILLVLAMLLSLCTCFAACNSDTGSSASDTDEEDDKKDDEKDGDTTNNGNNSNNGLVTVYLPIKLSTDDCTITFTRDTNGNIIGLESVAVSDEWEANLQCEYEYNEKGLLTKKVREFVEDGITQGTREIYTYDDSGNLIEELHYDTWNGEEYLAAKVTYVYDVRGNAIEEQIVYEAPPEERNYTYTNSYDATGNLTEVVTYSDGERSSRETYSYNGQGQLVEEVSYDNDGEVTGRTTYTYNEQGLLTKEVYFGDVWNGEEYTLEEFSKYTYTYDANGNMTERITYSYLTGYSYLTYVYENGCLTVLKTKSGATAQECMEAESRDFQVECVKLQVTPERAQYLQAQLDECWSDIDGWYGFYYA